MTPRPDTGTLIANAVLTSERMRAAEQRLMDVGTTAEQLMHRAGTGAAEWIWRISAGQPVTVLCGPGNNGGDGYVIAEALRQRGCDVSVVAPLPPRTDPASRARMSYRGAGESKTRGGVFVDCLFGIGLTRAIEEELFTKLDKLLHNHDFRVAVDLPSGVDADSGRLLNDLPQFDVTLALGAWKRAHWMMPAMAVMGERRLVPIGLDALNARTSLSQQPKLLRPSADDHKYTRGLVAVVGGAMPGAARLSCEAAMRGGAGYVKLFTDTPLPLPPDLVAQSGALPRLLQDERIGAVLIGPGLGRSAEASGQLNDAIASGHPLVLDADALILMTPAHLERRTGPVILTPHAGELVKLCETFSIPETGKVEQAQALARVTGAIVLAKGPDNILTDGAETRFFPPASSWLSVAGSGDVLAGIVASRLAAGGDAFLAAEEAVWLHGSAAHLCGTAPTALQIAQAVSDAYDKFL